MADDVLRLPKEKDQDEAEKKAKRLRERELNDIREIVATAEGRRFYWRVLEIAGNWHQSYTGDNNGTNFNEGRRSVGLRLFADLLEAKAPAFLQMQREHKSEINSNQGD